MINGPTQSDSENPLEELGLAPRRFVDQKAPEEVDLDLLRSYYKGELDPERAVDVDHLIAFFRDWHEASGQILQEIGPDLVKNAKK